MSEITNITNDDLLTTTWLGLVEDNEDPKLEGRCRIRVFGKFDARIDPEDPNSSFVIPVEHLPWARQCTNITGGSSTGGGFLSFPKRGSIVSVKFNEGNIYMPEYFYNVHVSDEVKTEVENSYQNSHVVLYDTAFGIDENGENTRQGEHIKVYFTEEKGLMMDYATANGSSIINIRNDNTILIEYPNGKIVHVQEDKISLGKETESDEPAVLGEKNLEALESLADRIQELTTAIQTFSTAQSTVATNIFLLAPLIPALTSLNVSATTTLAKLAADTRPKLPVTRSSTVSLDGPSKI